jgi:hypothetical protein
MNELRVNGVGRVVNASNIITLVFNRALTEDEFNTLLTDCKVLPPRPLKEWELLKP